MGVLTVVYLEDGTMVLLPESSLPGELPDDIKLGEPGNPLENHPTWKHTTCPYTENLLLERLTPLILSLNLLVFC